MRKKKYFELIKTCVQSRFLLKTIRFSEATKYLSLGVFNWRSNLIKANDFLIDIIITKRPSAIGKLGSVELSAIRKYLYYKDHVDFEYNTQVDRELLLNNAGVFPNDLNMYVAYCDFMINDVLPNLDAIAVWFNYEEQKIINCFAKKAIKLPLKSLEPYLIKTSRPWSLSLSGKKVLIIHPFAESINLQIKNIDKIWAPLELFRNCQIITIKAPLSPILEVPAYLNWFDSLENIKYNMDNVDYDVVLVGAGAFSLPLVCHAKAMGKIGVHMGGALQILFGITGKRWESIPEVACLINDYWVTPLQSEIPVNKDLIENGCYW